MPQVNLLIGTIPIFSNVGEQRKGSKIRTCLVGIAMATPSINSQLVAFTNDIIDFCVTLSLPMSSPIWLDGNRNTTRPCQAGPAIMQKGLYLRLHNSDSWVQYRITECHIRLVRVHTVFSLAYFFLKCSRADPPPPAMPPQAKSHIAHIKNHH